MMKDFRYLGFMVKTKILYQRMLHSEGTAVQLARPEPDKNYPIINSKLKRKSSRLDLRFFVGSTLSPVKLCNKISHVSIT